jgi:hypothetical protein
MVLYELALTVHLKGLGGGTLVLAPVGNVGTCRPDVKGETQVEIPQV